MNVRTFHRETIRGLIRNTVNRTHLDFERRGLIAVGTVIDWNNLRTLNQEINSLFASRIGSNREQTAVNNLIIEFWLRIAHLLPIIADQNSYEDSIARGIKVYSRYIKDNQVTRATTNNNQGFFQSLEDQFKWGILETFQIGFTVNPRIRQYQEYEQRVGNLTSQHFQNQGANPHFNNLQVQDAKQNLCWCLFSYRPNFSLYRTVLREYIEAYYVTLHLELQTQNNQFTIIGFEQILEPYIAQRCAYLHFNIENNASLVVSAAIRLFNYRRRQINNMTMTQQQLRQVLDAVLGQNGLDVAGLAQQLQNAVPPAPGVRELSIIKLPDFSGKPEEDPHEWTDLFEQAAAANQWQGDNRKIAICMGYLKGAALDWARAATVNGANQQITTWSGHNQTSMKPRLIAKFAPEVKKNQWYQELMTLRQRADERVDDFTLRFQRLLRKVNTNNLIPDALQVKMYLYGLNPLLTPMVVTDNPANLAAAIERARLIETGYNYVPTPAATTIKDTEVDELTKKIEQLTLNYANLASALTVQTSQTF